MPKKKKGQEKEKDSHGWFLDRDWKGGTEARGRRLERMAGTRRPSMRSRGAAGSRRRGMDAAADGEPRAPAAGEDSGKRVGRATGKERARVGRACEAVWVATLGPEQCVLAVYFQINRILEKKIKEPKQICRHDRMPLS